LELSQRVKDLPPYLFAEIDRVVAEKKSQGVDIIDFGIGDPDLPTPTHIVKKLCEEAVNSENHRYPSYDGMPIFREAAAAWISRRFGVSLDPKREVLTLIGSKEGIAHFPVTFLDEGDLALVPDPAYPVYRTATLLCGGIPVGVALREENGFLPDLSSIPEETWRNAKLFFLNYPNNPTAAVANLAFFEELFFYARKYEVILVHDNAYSEITYDGYRAPSLLEVPGARETAIEFHSLSKTYNMTGWRIGFAIGGERIIEAFRKVKTNIDSGVFNPIQLAGIAALEGPDDCIHDTLKIYSHRRDTLVNSLHEIGWNVPLPKASLYVWMKVPEGYDSEGFTRDLLEKTAVVVAPGSAYGQNGEGYIRFSLTLSDNLLEEGLRRIKKTFS
jgi:LL-diaminopimelate aminotransferase